MGGRDFLGPWERPFGPNFHPSGDVDGSQRSVTPPFFLYTLFFFFFASSSPILSDEETTGVREKSSGSPPFKCSGYLKAE